MEFLKDIYKKFIALNKKEKSYIIAVLSLGFVLLWAFISAGVITSNFNRSQIQNKENEQKVDAVGIIITETKEGNKYFEIYGEDGNYNNEDGIATLNNVIGNFYKDNKVAMSFQSSKGEYNEKLGTITLFENTYIVLEDLTSLNTDKLIWSGSDKETLIEGHVLIKKDKEMIATANRGVISPNYEKLKIIGNTNTKVFKNKENK